jgi:beta-xylosidase
MWEIGILRGDSPLEWALPGEGRNPILTACDITDVKAEFVADPFMIRVGQLWYLFFEVLPEKSERGEIGLAISRDTVSWEYQKIVLREPFHLSYPHVFTWEGGYYMVPETLDAEEVRIYRSRDFPFDWEHAHTPLSGQYADPTIVRHDDRWWLFACDTPHAHRSLRLFSAPELAGPWEEHPASPIIADKRSQARPAGPILSDEGRMVRFAQDCEERYGHRVWAFEITHLTRDSYREQPAAPRPVLEAGNHGGWRTHRMHHVDAHRNAGDGWVACVDGWGGAPKYDR